MLELGLWWYNQSVLIFLSLLCVHNQLLSFRKSQHESLEHPWRTKKRSELRGPLKSSGCTCRLLLLATSLSHFTETLTLPSSGSSWGHEFWSAEQFTGSVPQLGPVIHFPLLRYRPAMVGPCHRRWFPEAPSSGQSLSQPSRCQGAKCCCRIDRASNFWPCCSHIVASNSVKSDQIISAFVKESYIRTESSKIL